MKTTDFARCLTKFLGEYLPATRNVSENTIKSYRDTFKLFLKFLNANYQVTVEKLEIKDISEKTVLDFLSWLETERKCGISTRNQRLAAIHAFYHYLVVHSPENLLVIQLILQIPSKKYEKPVVEHLSPEQVRLLLEKPDVKRKTGRRDMTLLSVLYDTGARVQELCDLTVKDVRLDSPELIRLTGKGRKIRSVPLLPNTVDLLRDYMKEFCLLDKFDTPLFSNQQKLKLTRGGITYILQKYTKELKEDGFPEKVTPHVLRHSKAMHLYQAGVNLVYIRDILGHVDIATTDIYARADILSKRKALESAYSDITPSDLPEWNQDADLLDFLNNL